MKNYLIFVFGNNCIGMRLHNCIALIFIFLMSSKIIFAQGPYTPPYSFSFDDISIFKSDYTIVNGNNDLEIWTRNSEGSNWAVRYKWNVTEAADDWIFTPAITFSNKNYLIRFKYKTGTSFDEKFKLCLTNAITGNNSTIIKTIADFNPTQRINSFIQQSYVLQSGSVPTGNYYLGFHCYSDPRSYYLYIDDIEIRETNRYTIVASTGKNGTITPVGNIHTWGGLEQTFTITPNSGYTINTVKINNDITNVEKINNETAIYTFTDLQKNSKIDVTFKALPKIKQSKKPAKPKK
ncbi:hypothetical protein SDC9_135213 [bioreactor metagenome]|uniref:Bacterial repeat domain-containing protein n=1 Tax=bioreactor metagenome TaxID=1076179 RepID=A0A645DHP1_9ZZZZ